MKLSIEVRRDGELLGWYVTEAVPDLSTGTHFQSSTGDYYAYGSVASPLTTDPVLCIETNDDNEEPMRLNENFVSADSRRYTAELMQLAVDRVINHLIKATNYLEQASASPKEAVA